MNKNITKAGLISAIIASVILVEGNYSNDPDDPGGETKYGITAKVAREYGYTGTMQDLSIEEANKIYSTLYIYNPGFDKFIIINPAIAHNLNFGKTGSGTPFAKTTHNGQACGVADMNGCMLQPLLGIYQTSSSGTFAVARESYKMHDFTKANYNTSSNFDTIEGFYNGSGHWGNGSNCAFSTGSTNTERSMFGVFPVLSGASGDGTSLFGNDLASYYANSNQAVLAAGKYYDGSNAGVWYRSGGYDAWNSSDYNSGFRAAGYAK